MRIYKFYIADELTKIPLVGGEVAAFTKGHAKRKTHKEILNREKGYIILVDRLPKGR